jgi:hypothetical protein
MEEMKQTRLSANISGHFKSDERVLIRDNSYIVLSVHGSERDGKTVRRED